mmetsp:Transcript_3983/g.12697  ORF Transcript_3983/g.12697 Transcript_3983/m.12697 type:complete len:324 (+) Transcript_3983:1129-2100(+)
MRALVRTASASASTAFAAASASAASASASRSARDSSHTSSASGPLSADPRSTPHRYTGRTATTSCAPPNRRPAGTATNPCASRLPTRRSAASVPRWWPSGRHSDPSVTSRACIRTSSSRRTSPCDSGDSHSPHPSAPLFAPGPSSSHHCAPTAAAAESSSGSGDALVRTPASLPGGSVMLGNAASSYVASVATCRGAQPIDSTQPRAARGPRSGTERATGSSARWRAAQCSRVSVVTRPSEATDRPPDTSSSTVRSEGGAVARPDAVAATHSGPASTSMTATRCGHGWESTRSSTSAIGAPSGSTTGCAYTWVESAVTMPTSR